MKSWKIALGLLLVASTAAAQSTEVPPQPTPTPDPTPVPAPPPPAPTPGGFVETRPPMTEPHDSAERPDGFSIGIGAGYALPNSLETPNITSARFRLGSGLTFEAAVRLQQSSREVDVGATTKDKETTLELGVL